MTSYGFKKDAARVVTSPLAPTARAIAWVLYGLAWLVYAAIRWALVPAIGWGWRRLLATERGIRARTWIETAVRHACTRFADEIARVTR